MKKRIWLLEEKIKIIEEAKVSGVRLTLKKYKISNSLFYNWKQKYEEKGNRGLLRKKRPNFASLKKLNKDFLQMQNEKKDLDCQLDLYKELMGKFSISEIDVRDRAILVWKYNIKGLKLLLLFDICGIPRNKYYQERKNFKTSKS